MRRRRHHQLQSRYPRNRRLEGGYILGPFCSEARPRVERKRKASTWGGGNLAVSRPSSSSTSHQRQHSTMGQPCPPLLLRTPCLHGPTPHRNQGTHRPDQGQRAGRDQAHRNQDPLRAQGRHRCVIPGPTLHEEEEADARASAQVDVDLPVLDRCEAGRAQPHQRRGGDDEVRGSCCSARGES